MSEEFILIDSDGRYLADDFTTWTKDETKAHHFIRGAALNQCIEEFRRRGIRIAPVKI